MKSLTISLVLSLLLNSCATTTSSTYSKRKSPSITDFTQKAAIPLQAKVAEYPQRAILQRIEGWVFFEFSLTSDGKVENLKVLDSHPKDTFIKSASKSIKKWKFQTIERSRKYQYVMSFELDG